MGGVEGWGPGGEAENLTKVTAERVTGERSKSAP
jgi:hypothetical protein